MAIDMIDLKYASQNKENFYGIAKEYLRPDHKVLDIGAGNGNFAHYLNHREIYLYDGNPLSIEKLKKDFENCYLGKLPDLPFENNSFDIIHCSHVVEHLEPQVLYDTIKEMDRCLKGGGYLIISAPLLWSNFYDDLSHFKPYNPYVFIKYLVQKEETSPTRKKISSNYSNVRLQYRYKEMSLLENLYNSNDNFIIKIIFKVHNLLYRLGLRKYVKNGYTLVLIKNTN